MIRRRRLCSLVALLSGGCLNLGSGEEPIGFRRVVVINSTNSQLHLSVVINKRDELIHEADYSIDASTGGAANSQVIKTEQLGESAYYEVRIDVNVANTDKTVTASSDVIDVGERSAECMDVYVIVEPGPEIGVAPRTLESCE